MQRAYLLLVLSLFLTACASPYPLGMNEEQWNQLTPAERKALLLKEQEHKAEQRLATIKANAKTEQMRLENERIEARRLEKLYSNPGDGNVIMVNVLGGQYHYGKRQKVILEESYQVARGEVKKIKLYIKDPANSYTSNEYVYLRYDASGNGVYLYLDNPKNDDRNRIAMLRNGEWQCGTRYHKNLAGRYEQLLNMQFFIKESGTQCHTPARHRYPR